MKHTKGPWTTSVIKTDLAMNNVGIVEVNGPKGIICNCEESTFDETLANARLISAAPEMLVQLIEAVELLKRISPGNHYLERGEMNKTICAALGLDYHNVSTDAFNEATLKAKGGA